MKAKLKKIIWPVIYLVLIFNVVLSFILVFRSYYFKSIFVDGRSMEPTLYGNRGENQYADYGIIDDHISALNGLKRFKIITTYYPFQYSTDYVGGYKHGESNVVDKKESSYKIKRVYGMPGESIKFDVNEEWALEAKSLAAQYGSYSESAQYAAQKAIEFYVKKHGGDAFEKQDLKFKRKINVSTIDSYKYTYDLADDEYWVMGDNYSSSWDCFREKAPIYKDNLVGVLIAIEGKCRINMKNSGGSKLDDDGTKDYYYECVDRKRHFPVFY